MYLKTVKHLLSLCSSLEAGQLKISPSKKGQYFCTDKSLQAKSFLKSTKWEKEERHVKKESHIW